MYTDAPEDVDLIIFYDNQKLMFEDVYSIQTQDEVTLIQAGCNDIYLEGITADVIIPISPIEIVCPSGTTLVVVPNYKRGRTQYIFTKEILK